MKKLLLTLLKGIYYFLFGLGIIFLIPSSLCYIGAIDIKEEILRIKRKNKLTN